MLESNRHRGVDGPGRLELTTSRQRIDGVSEAVAPSLMVARRESCLVLSGCVRRCEGEADESNALRQVSTGTREEVEKEL